MVWRKSTDGKYHSAVPPLWRPPEGHTPVVLKPYKTHAVLVPNRSATDGSERPDRFGGEVDAESEVSVIASDSDVDVDAQPGESQQAEPAARSSSTDPPKQAVGLGETCRRKIHADVNAARSIEDIREYVNSEDFPSEFAREMEIPCRSIQDYTSTLRSAGSSQNSEVQWPIESLSYRKAADVSLHHCTPGHMVALENGRDIPKQFYGPQPAGATGPAQLRP
jgi:hypothetical protein